jgi:hypothetical protein
VRSRRVRSLLLALVCAVTIVGCEPTLQQETGVVIDIDSPALGRVDSFVLLTGDGERLTFDTSELEFRAEFPAPHLAEHRVLGDRIVVTYKTDGSRLLVTQLDDEDH